jgi:hypothetical protein
MKTNKSQDRMETFGTLKANWSWKPIRNCPGRYVLYDASTKLSPEELIGSDVKLNEYHVPGAKDAVIASDLGNGGLISYRRADGTYVHTLNTAEGFERKLQSLGIDLSAS